MLTVRTRMCLASLMTLCATAELPAFCRTHSPGSSATKPLSMCHAVAGFTAIMASWWMSAVFGSGRSPAAEL